MLIALELVRRVDLLFGIMIMGQLIADADSTRVSASS